MTRNLLDAVSRPIVGPGINQPITLCRPMASTPTAVKFRIPWAIYGAGAAQPLTAVNINMQQPGNTTQLEGEIRSVYVDNLGVNVPVFVWFPTTDFTVAVKPNSAAWYPVIASDTLCVIEGRGFTQNDITAVTTVWLSNLVQVPYSQDELPVAVQLGKASPLIQRGLTIQNSNYAPFALGDQTNYVECPATLVTSSIVLPVQTSGFYYLTNTQFNFVGIANPATATAHQILEQTGGPLIYQFKYTVFGGANVENALGVGNLQGSQIKLPATFEYRLRNVAVIGSGTGTLNIVYTYNPNDGI